MAHFSVVADTDDVVYGRLECQNLAGSDPSNAINNADSWKYFAENTPFRGGTNPVRGRIVSPIIAQLLSSDDIFKNGFEPPSP
ncbi:MAG: hypothetical protein KDI75_03295 [Xanthomonadales bacterium]|nr:hypothetical protein [Xanthomonadales bacterium]